MTSQMAFIGVALALFAAAQQAVNTNLGKDANGNPLRLATKTGHVSNYDESRVKPYPRPDPRLFADGTRVKDAGTWTSRRRPELIRLYETEIFGRIPPNTPRVTWSITPIAGASPDPT